MSIKKTICAVMLCLCILLSLCCCTVVKSEKPENFTINQFFASHMVLPRNIAVPVFGTGTDGTEVTVAYKNQIKKTTVSDGEWKVMLDAMSADAQGGTLKITADGKTTLLCDVLVGEVWFCSGQSNMVNTPKTFGPTCVSDFLPEADNQLVRVGRTNNLDWKICSTENIQDLSAYATAFAIQLQKMTGIPVGVVVRASGGTPIANFMSGTIFNMYIKPTFGLAFNGILWYQGESDTTHVDGYKEKFIDLVKMFRDGFNDQNLPFVATQLANYKIEGEWNRQWSDMRLLQLECCDAVANSYIVCQNESTRLAENIHPDNKKSLGIRAANLVGEKLWGIKDTFGSSPRIEKAEKTADGITVTFSGVNKGLSCADETVNEFRICRADGVFVSAEAVVTGYNTVLVKTENSEEITGVSYADDAMPYTNLLDGENPVFNFKYFFEE